MCLIIDGMDQNKLLLPALLNQAKSYASAWRLKTHLTGQLFYFCDFLTCIIFTRNFLNIRHYYHDSSTLCLLMERGDFCW